MRARQTNKKNVSKILRDERRQGQQVDHSSSCVASSGIMQCAGLGMAKQHDIFYNILKSIHSTAVQTSGHLQLLLAQTNT